MGQDAKPPQDSPYQIAVIGAGIGGMAAALLLARAGHDVTLFDQFDRPEPVGSGLVVQPVGQAVLDKLGLLDAATQRGAPLRRMVGINAETGRKVLAVDYDRKDPKDGAFGLAIHRAQLFGVLFDAVQQSATRLVSGQTVSQAVGHSITTLEGDEHGPFDLIIDASGANSPLSPLVAKPLPFGAIWGTVKWPAGTDLPKTQLSQCYRRADRMIGLMPCGLGADTTETDMATLFWSLPVTSYGAWRARGLDHWRAEATELWPAIGPAIAQITDADQMTMARYSHGTLRSPYDGPLIFIGDSAHRASPQLGQGANMALLDAAALAMAVAQAKDPLGVGPHYAQLRRRHVQLYQAGSWLFTPMYQSQGRILPVVRDWMLYPASQMPGARDLLSAMVRGDIIAPLRKA